MRPLIVIAHVAQHPHIRSSAKRVCNRLPKHRKTPKTFGGSWLAWPRRLRSQPRSRLATLTLGLWLPLLAADLLPESLDSLRTLAGLGKLQRAEAASTTLRSAAATGPAVGAGPWRAATAASGGPDARVSAAVDAGTGQLAAKAGVARLLRPRCLTGVCQRRPRTRQW